MVKFLIICSLALFACANALPLLVQDEEGQHYYLEPVESTDEVLSRRRRVEPKLPGPNDPKAFGQYGGGGLSNLNGNLNELSWPGNMNLDKQVGLSFINHRF